MKYLTPYLFCLLVLLSCKKETELSFEMLTIRSEACEDCPQVAISVPKILERSKVGDALERALQEEIIFLLTFEEEIEATTIEGAMTSFSEGYDDLKRMYPEEANPWEAHINAQVSYEDKDVMSVHLDSYIFTGGAHGYTATRYLNFSKQKGKELENWQLFKDTPTFEKYAERQFRKQENIPIEQPINSTGFMFERDAFNLPENIGFTPDGLQLLYNPYEVASFADGPIALTLPFAEVAHFLSTKVKS